MYLGLKNAEGYYDLTAYEAIKNVTAEERRKKPCIFYRCPAARRVNLKNVRW